MTSWPVPSWQRKQFTVLSHCERWKLVVLLVGYFKKAAVSCRDRKQTLLEIKRTTHRVRRWTGFRWTTKKQYLHVNRPMYSKSFVSYSTTVFLKHCLKALIKEYSWSPHFTFSLLLTHSMLVTRYLKTISKIKLVCYSRESTKEKKRDGNKCSKEQIIQTYPRTKVGNLSLLVELYH